MQREANGLVLDWEQTGNGWCTSCSCLAVRAQHQLLIEMLLKIQGNLDADGLHTKLSLHCSHSPAEVEDARTGFRFSPGDVDLAGSQMQRHHWREGRVKQQGIALRKQHGPLGRGALLAHPWHIPGTPWLQHTAFPVTTA